MRTKFYASLVEVVDGGPPGFRKRPRIYQAHNDFIYSLWQACSTAEGLPTLPRLTTVLCSSMSSILPHARGPPCPPSCPNCLITPAPSYYIPNLTTVDVDPETLRLPALLALGECPKLTKLGLCLEGDNYFATVPHYEEYLTKRPLFPSLTTARLDGGLAPDFEVHIALLRAISSCTLTSLLCVAPEATAENVSLLFKALAEHPSRNAFASIEVSEFQYINLASDRFPYCSEDPGLTMETFLPLCTLPKIQKFVLSTWMPLPTNDDLVERLAAAWPNLRFLELVDARPPLVDEQRPCITYKSLVTLARKCPRLTELAIAFDFADAPELVPDGRSGRSRMPVALEFLVRFSVAYTLQSYGADAQWALARLLSATMPNLAFLDSKWHSVARQARSDHSQRTKLGRHVIKQSLAWEDVCDKVIYLAEIRQQERRWVNEQQRQPRNSLR